MFSHLYYFEKNIKNLYTLEDLKWNKTNLRTYNKNINKWMNEGCNL